MPSPGRATCLPGGHCCQGGPARTLGRGDSHHTSFVALTPQPVSRFQCQHCRCHLPCPPKLRGLVQGLVVLGVVVLGEDKRVFFVVLLLLLLVVGVVAEGYQRPPQDLGTREALKCGPFLLSGMRPSTPRANWAAATTPLSGCILAPPSPRLVLTLPRTAAAAKARSNAGFVAPMLAILSCPSRPCQCFVVLGGNGWSAASTVSSGPSSAVGSLSNSQAVIWRPCKIGRASNLARAGVLAG
jgi:hypothetical protein